MKKQNPQNRGYFNVSTLDQVTETISQVSATQDDQEKPCLLIL